MPRGENKCHLHTRTVLSETFNVQVFASTHFTAIPGSFIIRNEETNLRSLTDYTGKERFLVKRNRDLRLGDRNRTTESQTGWG